MNKLIVTTQKQGIILYSISSDFQMKKELSILDRRHLRAEQSIIDARWSKPLLVGAKHKEFILFCSSAKNIKLIDSETYKIVKEYSKLKNKATTLLWNPLVENNEFFLSGHENGTINYWHKDQTDSLYTISFKQQNSQVKHLSYNLKGAKMFACGHEDGKVFVWNTQSPNDPKYQFQLGRQTVEGVEWHPAYGKTLMSGGKNIRITHMQDNKLQDEAINTFRGKLNALRWRPGTDKEISYASENLLIVLNKTRPYLNHYMIQIQSGPIVSFEWHKNNNNIIIAGKKDIVIASLKDAFVPLTVMNVAVFDIDVMENIVFLKQHNFSRDPKKLMKMSKPDNLITYQSLKNALKYRLDSFIDRRADGMQLGSRRFYGEEPKKKRKERKITIDQRRIFQRIQAFNSDELDYKEKDDTNITTIKKEDTIDPDEVFVKVDKYTKLAHLFKFQGDSICNLCKHNSTVAKEQGYEELSQSWDSLQILYHDLNGGKYSHFNEEKEKSQKPYRFNTFHKLRTLDSGLRLNGEPQGNQEAVNKKHQTHNTKNKRKKSGAQLKINFVKPKENYKIYSNFDIEAGNSENPGGIFMPASSIRKPQKVKKETVRQSGQVFKPKVISLSSAKMRPSKKVQKEEKTVRLTHIEYDTKREKLHCSNEVDCSESLNIWANDMMKQSILDIIFYYAENGDLQSSSIMLLIFKSKIAIPNSRVSSVVRGYLNVLQRLKAWCIAAEVVKFCQIADIQNEYGKSSMIKTKCQHCRNKESGTEVKCYLDKCGKFNSHCSICDIPVRGRMWWCQLCGHGGHSYHMKEWFQMNTTCPTGCGHNCLDDSSYLSLFLN
ncbi:unnamed protein product [Moneuplotes crassus]|uniref:WDR59/RTC1-like RING zinc finger domain-containing protein n=1 Tax=Euplotes crassus TaxID=5936 RepID=A0AAD2D9H6_EUPCR|nr:unnamed protein product [Moneuplotes crassus]